MLTDKSKFIAKSGKYSIAPTGGVADKILLGIGAEYEEELSRRLKVVAPSEIPSRLGPLPKVHWSVKYDGEGALVYYDQKGGAVCFAAPSGRARLGFKALAHFEEVLKKEGIRKALFRGELYLPFPGKKQRPGVAGVTRTSFSTEKGASDAFRIALFDCVMLDGKDLRADEDSFAGEWDQLGKLFGDDAGKPVHRARGGWTEGSKVEGVLKDVLEAGEEGLVIRRDGAREMFKLKPAATVDAVVIGFVEGAAEKGIAVSSLLFGLTHAPAGDRLLVQSLVRTGNGLDDAQAMELHARLKAIEVDSPLLLNDSEGRGIRFVRPELIAELEGEDWVEQRSDGKPVRAQAFEWDGKTWGYAGLAVFPRFSFPKIVRLREDKDVASGGARIAQAPCEAQAPVKAQAITPPEVLRREVYRKGDAVRKFLLVRRTEEDAMPLVFYCTDFSAGRKEPLKVSTEYAFNDARAEALFEAALKEGVKKGWQKVG